MDERIDMRLKWEKDEGSLHTYRAESARYRFILIAPWPGSPSLWVQPVTADWGSHPIDQRMCRTRRGAERIAQRFENAVTTPRRLR
jgi:hypothetical protein